MPHSLPGSMLHQPTAQLLGHNRLTGYRHFARPLPIDANMEAPRPREGQINKFYLSRSPVW